MQCKAVTKTGRRCRITNGVSEGYCRIHADQRTLKGDTKPVEPAQQHADLQQPDLPTRGRGLVWFAAAAALVLLIFCRLRRHCTTPAGQGR
jgi:hypothetical protein